MSVVYSEAGPKDVTRNGHFMETQAWLDSDNGHIEAITHTWTTNWVFGFTGSVGMVFLGEDRRPLGHHSEAQWPLGVDARGVFWHPSSRTDAWSLDIDSGLAQSVREMLIIHSHHEKNRLNDILSEISGYEKSITQFCVDNPETCIAIGGLF